jgi:hypothetical protein
METEGEASIEPPPASDLPGSATPMATECEPEAPPEPTTSRLCTPNATAVTSKRRRENEVQALVRTYYTQMSEGCSNPACQNLLCRTNQRGLLHTEEMAGWGKNDFAKLALQLGLLPDRYICDGWGAPFSKVPASVLESLSPEMRAWTESALQERERIRLCTPPPGATAVTLQTVRDLCVEEVSATSMNTVVKFAGQLFSDSNWLNYAFLKEGTMTTADASGVDFAAIEEAYTALYAVESESGAVACAMRTASSNLVKTLKMTVATHFNNESLADIRQFIVLLLDPNLMEYSATPEYQPYVLNIFECITERPSTLQDILVKWFQNGFSRDAFEMMHHVFHTYITVRISSATISDDRRLGLDIIFPAVKMLGLFHRANVHLGWLQPKDYYNDAVNAHINMREDYMRWRYWNPPRQGHERMSFCSYPWILNAESKAEVIRHDGRRQMNERFQQSVQQSVFQQLLGGGGGADPFFKIKVRRDSLLDDTTRQFSRHPDELKKPLKVEFVGEEGVDEGGVRKEFFQLITPLLLDEDIGMFAQSETTRNHWFRTIPAALYDAGAHTQSHCRREDWLGLRLCISGECIALLQL